MLLDLSDDENDADPDLLSPEYLINDPGADLLALLDNCHFLFGEG